MVTVDQYARIRLAHRDGLSIRELARRFHHSRYKIREILSTPEPKRYQRLKPPPSILEPLQAIIDSILVADEQAPRKQRHTAAKLYRRLVQEYGYGGSYDRVCLYVRSIEVVAGADVVARHPRSATSPTNPGSKVRPTTGW